MVQVEPQPKTATTDAPRAATVHRPSMVRRAVAWTADMGRYVMARGMFAVADYLPRRASGAIAGTIAAAECTLTRRGRALQAEGRLVFGLSSRKSWQVARRTMLVPYLDLIDLRRISTRRDDLRTWKPEAVNDEAFRAMLTSGQPVLVAGGHFAFTPLVATLHLTVPEIHGTAVAAPIEPFRWRGEVLLRRLTLGMIHSLAEVLRPGAAQISYVGERDVQGEMLEELGKPGGVGFVMIDTDWRKPKAHVRPFCGIERAYFAVGAARIARLAQAPVFIVVPERTGMRSARVHYYGPFTPPPKDDAASDRAFTDELLDELERCVGRFRENYPRPVGWSRRWDAPSERWVAAGGMRGAEAPGRGIED